VILRLDKFHMLSTQQQLKKVTLIAKAFGSIESLKCGKTVPSTSAPTVVPKSDEKEETVCQKACTKHTSQVLKWGLLYNGRTSVHDFLFRLQELKYSSEISDAELLRNCVHLFEGEALLWFRTNRSRVDTFDSLIELLKLEFQPLEYERCLKNQIRARLQDEKESIKTYINIMEGLFLRLSKPVSEEEQLEIIMANMSSFYISGLALHKIESIKELKEVCSSLEVAKFKCDYRGFLSTGKESIVPTLYNQGVRAAASTGNAKPAPASTTQNRSTNICLKCGGTHHHTRCDIHPTPICFKCRKPGVTTRTCGCSKNQ
jgi:hypothetical protein